MAIRTPLELLDHEVGSRANGVWVLDPVPGWGITFGDVQEAQGVRQSRLRYSAQGSRKTTLTTANRLPLNLHRLPHDEDCIHPSDGSPGECLRDGRCGTRGAGQEPHDALVDQVSLHPSAKQ